MFKNGTEFCGEFSFDDFRVIILKVKSDDGVFFEAWIRHKDYGIMDFMYCLQENEGNHLENFKDFLLKNIVQAIDNYEYCFMDMSF